MPDSTSIDPEPSHAVGPSHTTEAAAGTRSRPTRRLVVGAIVGLLVIGLAVFAVSTRLELSDKNSLQDRRADALSAAEAFAAIVTTYQHDNLDANFAAVLDGSTGELKAQYTTASKAVRSLIAKANADAQGTVVAAGVQSATDDRATVLVFLDQKVTSSAGTNPQVVPNRLLVSLERHGNRWLVSKLDLK